MSTAQRRFKNESDCCQYAAEVVYSAPAMKIAWERMEDTDHIAQSMLLEIVRLKMNIVLFKEGFCTVDELFNCATEWNGPDETNN